MHGAAAPTHYHEILLHDILRFWLYNEYDEVFSSYVFLVADFVWNNTTEHFNYALQMFIIDNYFQNITEWYY